DKKREEIEKRIEDENVKLNSFEKNLDELKAKASDMEKEISGIRETCLLKEQTVKRIDDNLQFNLEKTSEFKLRIEELNRQNVENVGKMEELREELKIKEENLIKSRELIELKEKEFAECGLILRQTQDKYEETKQINETKQDFLNKIMQEFNALKNDISVQDTLIKGMEEKIAFNETLNNETEEKLKKLNMELENIMKGKILKEDEAKQIKSREETLIKDKIRRMETLASFDDTIKDFSMNLNRLETKLSFLKNLYEQLEGYGEAVRKILFEFKAQLDEPQKENIVGVIGNIVKVKQNCEKAVEKALKDILQTIIVRNDSLVEEIFTLYEKEKDPINIVNMDNSINCKDIIGKWQAGVKHKKIIAHLLSV
ncbi:MAG TPA: hypothetical protein PLF61_07335, partial [Candidatus Goldiibacteriota bacterium]|nr:hypothetical protein [Candidatus Goldiibacteriota bacterium]